MGKKGKLGEEGIVTKSIADRRKGQIQHKNDLPLNRFKPLSAWRDEFTI